MPVSQDAVFVESEGDAWFRRNAAALSNHRPETDLPMRLIDMYDLKPKRVLEIGASNGYRVSWIQHRYQCYAAAVDASKAAIEDGERWYEFVEYYHGTADNTGIGNKTFDLVIVNYVLHWVGRDKLLSAIAEIDRLTAPGGYVLLGDFFPNVPMDVPYHHKHGLMTYKRDYAAMLRASGLYQSVALITNAHGAGLVPDAPDSERGCTWLLRKLAGG